ncbi:amidase family protein [soil metagenome]
MPASAGDFALISAHRALALFAARAISPRDVFDAVVKRIESRNSGINAFGDMFLDEAGDRVREAEKRWIDGTARPLEGILVAVKDAQRVAGQRTTYGSPAFKDNVAARHDPMIERLLEAGAIIHARTTTSEFCVSGVCVSPMWGTTRNPWNLKYSPGGSSGGSAAALAAGMTTLATGTDMGGSIRVPASACGVAGYKPPHGRNPDGAPFNVERFNHCGPLARSVADLALFQNIVSGLHAEDPDSLPNPPVLPTIAGDVSGMRVAWSPDLSYKRVSKEVLVNTGAAVGRLRSLGCVCEQIDLEWTGGIDRAALAWYAHFGTSSLLLEAVARDPAAVSSDLTRLARDIRQARTDSGELPHVFAVIADMSARFERAMRGFDVFVCPAMGVPAVRADQSMWATDFEIEGVRVDPEFGYSLTHQFNMLATCPVVAVPSGLAKSGLPTGVQIVGKPFDEHAPMRLALAYEAASPLLFP